MPFSEVGIEKSHPSVIYAISIKHVCDFFGGFCVGHFGKTLSVIYSGLTFRHSLNRRGKCNLS